MADQRIDFSRHQPENESVNQKVFPERELRPQNIKEANPDYTRKEMEKDGRSNWSGGWAGGRTR